MPTGTAVTTRAEKDRKLIRQFCIDNNASYEEIDQHMLKVAIDDKEIYIYPKVKKYKTKDSSHRLEYYNVIARLMMYFDIRYSGLG